MSNNSWKQYGGQSKMDNFNVINASTIVAEQFVSRSTKPIYQYLHGTFEVSMDLSAGINILAGNSIYSNVDLFVNKDIYSNNKIYFGGNTFNNTYADFPDYTFPARAINSTHAFFFGDASFVGLNTVSPETNFHITATIPEHTDILTIENKNAYIRNIMAQNKNKKGIVMDANDTNSNIHFFTDNSTNSLNTPDATINYTENGVLSTTTTNAILSSSRLIQVDTSGGTIYMDAIKTQVDSSGYIVMNTSAGFILDTSFSYSHIDNITGDMYTDTSGQFILHSSGGYFLLNEDKALLSSSGHVELHASGGYVEIDSNGGEIVFNSGQVNLNTLLDFTPPLRGLSGELYNETITVYDNSNSTFLPNVYDIPNLNTGNAIVGVGKDPSANTFIRLAPATSLQGSAYGGGLYPYDWSRSMNMLGVNDICGNFVPNQMILEGNNKAKYVSTLGINTFMPKTEQYTVDLNGPLRIANGEINTVSEVNFEILSVSFSKSHPLSGIAVGTPYTLFDSTTSASFKQNLLYTNDGGVSWNLSDIYQVSPDNDDTNVSFNSVIMYDNNFGFFGGNNGYLFYTNNGGKNIAKFGLGSYSTITINSISIHTIDSANIKLLIFYNNNQLIQHDIPLASLDNDGLSLQSFSGPTALGFNVISTDTFNNNTLFVGEKIGKFNGTDINTINNNSYNNIFNYDNTYIIAVGNGSLTYTEDGGSNWTTVSFTGINITDVYMRNQKDIVIVGDQGYFAYTKNGPADGNWQIVPDSLLNSSGMAKRITDSKNMLKTIHMIVDSDAFIISNVITPSSNTTDNSNDIVGYSKIQYVFLPGLFNRDSNTVLDICGNMMISGNIESIDGRLFVGQNTILHGDASFNTRLFVADDVSFNRRLFVNHNSIFQGDVSLNSRLFVNNDVSFNNKLFVENSIILPSTSSIYSNNIDAYVDNLNPTGNFPNYSNNINIGHNTQITNIGPVDTAPNKDPDNNSGFAGKVINIGAVSPNDEAESVKIQMGTYNVNDTCGNSIRIGGGADKVVIGGGITFETQETLQVTNPIIDINANKTGTMTSGNAGIYITDNNDRKAGYMRVINDTDGFSFKAPIANSQTVCIETEKLKLTDSNSYNIDNGINSVNNGIMMLTRRYDTGSSTIQTDASYSIVVGNFDISNVLVRDSNTSNDIIQDIKTKLIVQEDVSFNQNLYIGKDLIIDGNLSVEQYSNDNIIHTTSHNYDFLTVAEDMSLNGRMFIRDDVSMNSRLFVGANSIMIGDVSMNSRLFVNHDVSLNNRLFVGSNTIMVDDVSMNNRLFVNHDVSLNNRLFVGSNTIMVGDVSMNNRLFVNHDVSLNNNLYVNDFVYIGRDEHLQTIAVDISFSNAIRIPAGPTSHRPIDVDLTSGISATGFYGNIEPYTRTANTDTFEIGNTIQKEKYKGCIRYNTDNQQFEGFGAGNNWGSLGGVVNVAQDTKILAEDYPDAKNNQLTFYTAYNNLPRLQMIIDASSGGVAIGTTYATNVNDNLLDISDNSLLVEGKVGIGSNNPIVILDVSGTDALHIPKGSTTQRPINKNGETYTDEHGAAITEEEMEKYQGCIRYNYSTSQFEGFGAGNTWGSLGGVVNVEQNTQITAESSAAGTNNQLSFYTAYNGEPRLQMIIDASSGGVAIGTTYASDVSNNTLDISDNSLIIEGKVGIGSNNPIVILDVSGTDALHIPKGSTGERPIKITDTGTGFADENSVEITAEEMEKYQGCIRYNYTTSQFEGFGPGNNWGSLGGVVNVAQNTKIIAESSAAATNNQLMFFTAPSGSTDEVDKKERMRIDNNGNIGIGYTVPRCTLDISGVVNIGPTPPDTQGGSYLPWAMSMIDDRVFDTVSGNSDWNNNLLYIGRESYFTNVRNFNHIKILLNHVKTNDTTWNSHGKIAWIGGNSGSTERQIEGNLSAWIDCVNDSGNTLLDDGGCIAFATAIAGNNGLPTERMRIHANGNVGIGTDDPQYKLDVNGNIRVNNIYGPGQNSNINIYTNTSSYDSESWAEFTTNRISMGGPEILLYTGSNDSGSGEPPYGYGVVSVSITTAGMTIHGETNATSFNAVSDIRHKENICDLENALEKINTIRGVKFNFKDNDKIHAGIIAQEVAPIMPELINKDNDDKWSANYDGLIPYLIESVKTLTKNKEDMQHDIEELKRENEELKEKMTKYDLLFEQLLNK